MSEESGDEAGMLGGTYVAWLSSESEEDDGVASDRADSEAREARIAEAWERGGRMPKGWPSVRRSGTKVVELADGDMEAEARIADACDTGGKTPNGFGRSERGVTEVDAFIVEDGDAGGVDGVLAIRVAMMRGVKRLESVGGAKYVTTIEEEIVETDEG
ncbi:hypothetical protein BKA81DRAFT_351199 [Phyllosticta paracitricarpa]